MAPEASRAAPPLPLRVLTYNAFQCPNLNYTRDLLKDADADLVCLQELVIEDFRHEPRNQASWLGDALGLHHVSTYTCRGRYRNAGSAILSKYPLVSLDVLVESNGHRFGLTARVDCRGEPVALVCAHYFWLPRPVLIGLPVSVVYRTAEVRRTVAWLKRQQTPGIVAGDLNAVPHTPEYVTMTRHLADCTRAVTMDSRCTWPRLGLPIQLDYVFASRCFRTLSCRTLDCRVSDHRPLVAELEFTPPATGYRPSGRKQMGGTYNEGGSGDWVIG